MQNVLIYLQENELRFVRELCDYLRFPSVSTQSHHRADVEAAARWLVEHCQSIGLHARLCPTEGNPVVIAQTPRNQSGSSPRRHHFVIYGHYDVQPAEPFDLWKSPPFEPRLDGRSLFARGACDNKGQHFAHLKAVEAYLKTNTDLPCDLTFVIEGEEADVFRGVCATTTGLPSVGHSRASRPMDWECSTSQRAAASTSER